jgi:hypothetical protein
MGEQGGKKGKRTRGFEPESRERAEGRRDEGTGDLMRGDREWCRGGRQRN